VSPYALSDEPLSRDPTTAAKLALNLKRNRAQDKTELMDEAAKRFDYELCKDQLWNPEEFSLLWGTPLWDEASAHERVLLNQLYWVAYYSQIISAEIATIFFNQTAAAGMYGVDGLRIVGDTLDLESNQERAHINVFKTVCESTEQALFGERVFSYPMRSPYAETMTYGNSNWLKRAWKGLQLRFFGMLSAGNPFIAAQYFTVRGIRTLNGKIIQHQLSSHYESHPQQEQAPIPAKISYDHFCDESYHFNSSTIISQDLVRSLPPPSALERTVANLAVRGCQRDHFHFSATLNGIFWHDPATFPVLYKVLTSRIFGMDDRAARDMIRRCFSEENEGISAAYRTHRTALDSYRSYVADMKFISPANKAMTIMERSSIQSYLSDTRAALRRFERRPRCKASPEPAPISSES